MDGIYFIGAGGIGMSALIRYFLAKGFKVAGYDRTPSALTDKLIAEGADIHYVDDVALIPEGMKRGTEILVVYTPAVPEDHSELQYFRQNGYKVLKRSQLLGLITENARGICVAGTHGKTTTSSMIAHLLKQSKIDCNAFLGGILKNYDSNLMLSDSSDLTVIEADEYDRSFHYLKPFMAVITSADPDHLDIYGTPEAYRQAFEKFISLIKPGGTLIIKKEIAALLRCERTDIQTFNYSMTDETADFHAKNIRVGNGEIFFDFVIKNPVGITVPDVQLGVPVRINIENGVAAMAAAYLNGVTPDEMKQAMKTFRGAERRFDFQIKTDRIVYIDDYAHHPQELANSIRSVKELYPNRKLTGIFQPHLYTRTRDFADEFAKTLSQLDRLILLDIYPAREEPIEGVTSEMLLEKATIKDKTLCSKEELIALLEKEDLDVLMTLGAGDIDRFVSPIRNMLIDKYKL
ncbi:MAG: UDP-N-acetylmuramate--L-alanine ligase [Tannerella sp.]|jgi:UDP-N-acetylmuramate--alanine ligase|nr:UDP-N-acetylmuramate--L-alanine ligase [Tannerella sp.]